VRSESHRSLDLYCYPPSCTFSLKIIFSSHCHSARSFLLNQLTGTIPPQLGNLTRVSSLYAQNWFIMRDDMHLQRNSLPNCYCCDLILSRYSIRSLSANQLTGTIPPQLSNIPTLETLYAQNHSLSMFNNVCDR